MYIDEVRAHYKSWAEMGRRLDMGSHTYRRWLKIGYIPYTTQCVIENKTNRLFIARKDHEKPRDES